MNFNNILGGLGGGGLNNLGGGGLGNLAGLFSNMQNQNQNQSPQPNFSAEQKSDGFYKNQNGQENLPNWQNNSQGEQTSFFQNNGQNNSQNGGQNGGQNNSQMLQSILPMLMGGGGANQADLLSSLAKNNPSMGGIMSMLPNLQTMQSQNPTRKKQKKSPTFVKVKDYYNE